MPVLPLTTPRLRLRVMQPSDAPTLVRYRNDPDVARYQDWPLPYTLEDADEMLGRQAGYDDLVPDAWTQVAIEHDGEVVGDVAVGWAKGGTHAYIGYSLAPEHQGKGYASEAVEAVVDALFATTDVHRLLATMDWDNLPSMRLVEELGFDFDARLRKSELVRGEWVDDTVFSLLREERSEWLARPRSRPETVDLVEMTEHNRRAVLALRTHKYQEQFVASMPKTFCDALAPETNESGVPAVPWFRAIAADGEIVGFVMVAEVAFGWPEPFLWRLLIDRRHQRRGIATEVLRQLCTRYRDAGHTTLMTSWSLGPGTPQPFYEKLGFVPTGGLLDGEIEARLRL